MLRTCNQCKQEKEIGQYYRRGDGPMGYNTRCKQCMNNAPGHLKGKSLTEWNLLRSFGITLAQYDALMKLQNDSCSLCNTHRSNLKRNLNVDHCHKTGRIRGLLCNNCNMGLGMFKDDTTLLKKVISYVETVNLEVDKIVKSE